jgi:NADH:ubiquinone reductase (H+-translocating)
MSVTASDAASSPSSTGLHEIVIVGGGAGGLELATRLGDAGLESNRINQLLVGPTLQTMRDENIFAFGQCAACPWPERGGTVPPRAQAAHQQASHLLAQIRRRLAGKPPR